MRILVAASANQNKFTVSNNEIYKPCQPIVTSFNQFDLFNQSEQRFLFQPVRFKNKTPSDQQIIRHITDKFKIYIKNLVEEFLKDYTFKCSKIGHIL